MRMRSRIVRDDRWRSEAGAAATELALIAPILIVLFFGIVQVGLAVWRSQVIEAAAREGARVASVGGGDDDVETAADNAATGFTDTEVLSTITDPCDALGDDVTVYVTASGLRLNFEIPFVGAYTPVYDSEATFRCEVTP